MIYKGNDNYYLEGTSSNASKPDGGLIAGGSYADAYGTAALTANTWSYLAVTYDGATVRLYVNGTQVASTAHTGTIATSTNPLQIGGDSIYGQYFDGMIDEVRVYNTALTATQIQTDMTTPIAPTGPDTTRRPARHAGRDRGLRRRDRPRLDGLDRQRRRHRLPDRALPQRRLHLRADRHRHGTTPPTATPASPPTPATATASAPPTPPATSAPTPTPPPPPRRPGHAPPTQPGTLAATAVSARRDRPRLGRLDRQRRRHRLPGRALPDRRLHLRPDRHHQRHHHHLQRHHRHRLHQLQLPRPRHRRRRQPQPLLQHRHRHHTGRHRSGLVAAYGFDEGSGTTVTDQSGNGNTGTITGATWTATGKYGNALSSTAATRASTSPTRPRCTSRAE